MSGTRRLLTRLREMMATGAAPLADVVRLVAAEMVAEVCSLYALRTGDVLELIATYGLRPDAVGRTRLRMGEGIVGISAATGKVQNLADAQNHPAFAYRAETGEEKFASLLAVPVRRGGHTMGVLAVQNRSPRRYGPDEVDTVETVAMLLAEALAAAGAAAVSEDALSATLPRQFDAASLAPGLVIGPVVSVGLRAGPRNFLSKDPRPSRGGWSGRWQPCAATWTGSSSTACRTARNHARCWRRRGWSPPMTAGSGGCRTRSAAG